MSVFIFDIHHLRNTKQFQEIWLDETVNDCSGKFDEYDQTGNFVHTWALKHRISTVSRHKNAKQSAADQVDVN